MLKRKFQRERRSFAEVRRHRDLSMHQSCELACQRQTQPRAAEFARQATLQLPKLLEHGPMRISRDADARILDRIHDTIARHAQ